MGLRHRASSLLLLSLALGLAVALVSGNSVAGSRLAARRPFALHHVCVAVGSASSCSSLLFAAIAVVCGLVSVRPWTVVVNSSSSFEFLGMMLRSMSRSPNMDRDKVSFLVANLRNG
jgi:hypothetical protein